jgi:membrane protease YdiL (CAAX protease family)
MNENNEDATSKSPLGWKVCPFCGAQLPKLAELKFCTSCGIDLEYLKTHKKIPPDFLQRLDHTSPQISDQQSVLWNGIKQISDEEILETQDKKLWSVAASIGLTIAAVVIMNFIAVALVIPFIFLTPSIEALMNSLSSPYFIIITSFAELILIVFPIIYIKKYLKNPTIKNRFALLGFTTKGMSSWKVIKEILIGLVFSVIGIIVVLFVSFFVEIIVEFFFGLSVIRDVSSSNGNVDMIILASDIPALILLMLIMILVIGTSEEILFRGFMQKGLVRRIGKKWGLMVTALIFTFIHLIGSFLIYDIFSLSFLVSFILSFFPYLAISSLLGLVYMWRKENLISVMIMHGFYDALTVLMVFMFYNLTF